MKDARAVVTLALLVALRGSSLQAIAPDYRTDEELTRYPIIVVAKWDKAEFESHSLVEGNACMEWEAFTELDVQRVIKGDIEPGRHKIMLSYGVGWFQDGTGLSTRTSTDLPGDVDDVTEPNLWFLDRKRSWDKSDETLYYHVPYYRAIQPRCLEPYFAALGSEEPETRVPQLLSGNDVEVVRRSLRYTCGWIWPWPYDPDEFDRRDLNPKYRGKILRDEAERVREVVEGGPREVRALAAAVYAELKGEACIEYMRGLFSDRDPDVRAVAVGILARFRDETSIEAMVAIRLDLEDGLLSCKLIEALAAWGDDRFVPLLIAFLQNDTLAYEVDDDAGIIAVKARYALHRITGYWFPYDVASANDVWRQATTAADDNQRKEILARLLPRGEFPIVAELVGSPRKRPVDPGDHDFSNMSPALRELLEPELAATVRVTNTSGREVTLAKRPTSVDFSGPCAFSSGGMGPIDDGYTRDDFVTLQHGESLEFEVSMYRSFLVAEPRLRSVKLVYEENGNEVGVNAWIGAIDAEFGPQWKEERKTEMVDQRWPNGNLKVVGQTVNGERFGEWNYFNEEGDRIRIVDYSKGWEAQCNPTHPSNKGAGRTPPADGTD